MKYNKLIIRRLYLKLAFHPHQQAVFVSLFDWLIISLIVCLFQEMINFLKIRRLWMQLASHPHQQAVFVCLFVCLSNCLFVCLFQEIINFWREKYCFFFHLVVLYFWFASWDNKLSRYLFVYCLILFLIVYLFVCFRRN